MFHPLSVELVEQSPLPEWFTNPFDYTPHPLVVSAAQSVARWVEPLGEGKMFGVLIVERDGEVGFLAAFSGMLSGSYNHPGFVPTIFDIEQSSSYLESQRVLKGISRDIEILLSSEEYFSLKEELATIEAQSQEAMEALRSEYTLSKAERNLLRKGADEATLRALSAQSSEQKRQIKAQRAQWGERVAQVKSRVDGYLSRVTELKSQRSQLSLTSQQSIFKEFIIHNARGESESLFSIFQRVTQQLPPSGAGECAAPKLVEYALLNGMMPRAMGEFWLGKSPVGEPRHAGQFYTSCSGKCLPILGYMLDGLPVESRAEQEPMTPTLLFEDEHVVIFDKPSGMLSVKGKVSRNSLDVYMDGLHTVHRLDMDTSGVIIFAKSAEVKVALQRQFEERTAKKSYVALCRGEVLPMEGVVSLPLRGDLYDRPRQIVDYEHGKQATTHYKVVDFDGVVSRVIFSPITGRTHQLRLHSAHPDGLAAPIVGDRLYGERSTRLHLHAQSLSFTHPVTGERMTITATVPF
ncbi:MAG: pseudouridine synthase [Rikenellaceae bacterium]